MTAPSKNFTVIADTAIDADSPLTEDLMTDLRDNDIHLEEWLGKSYTAAVDHDHDGSNSARVAGASGGVGIAIGDHRSNGVACATNLCMFEPECAIYMDAEANSEVYVNNEADDAIALGTNTHTNEITALQLGGALLKSTGPGVAGDRYAFSFFKSITDLVKVGKFTGDGGASQVVTVGFQPEFVLVWEETGSGTNPTVWSTNFASGDSRGLQNGTIYTTGITASSSTSFTVGSSLNTNTVGYMYLALKSGNKNGERIQVDNYTGTGSPHDITNSAGFTPQMVIFLNTDTTGTGYNVVMTMLPMNSFAKRVDSTTHSSSYATIIENGVALQSQAENNGSGKSNDVVYILGGGRPG